MTVYIALLHYPVYNKKKELVSTCITGFDLHDIARTAISFGVKKYFVVNPMPAQRAFAERIREFWLAEASLEFNWTRAEAFKLVSIKAELSEVIKEIEELEGIEPKIIATSAKDKATVGFKDLRLEIAGSKKPYLILFGTGWGLADEVFSQVDAVLPPIQGPGEYNHLSVRGACAIILHQLCGR